LLANIFDSDCLINLTIHSQQPGIVSRMLNQDSQQLVIIEERQQGK